MVAGMAPDPARHEHEPWLPVSGGPTWAAVHEADLALAEGLERAGLTLTQALVLREIARHDHGLAVRTLGERMRMSAPSTSRLCQRLERASFIDRIGGPRRAVAVRATDGGRRALELVDRHRATSWGGILSRMGPSERADLVHGLACEPPASARTSPEPPAQP